MTTPSECIRHRAVSRDHCTGRPGRDAEGRCQRGGAGRDLDAPGAAGERHRHRDAPRRAEHPREHRRGPHPADRRMRRIQRPASAFQAQPDHQADAPDAGGDQRGDRARVDHGRERQVAEGRRAHDHRRQAGLGRERTGLGHRVEPVTQRRGEPVDGVGGAPAHRRGHGQRTGRRAHAGCVVVGGPSGECVGEREPELRAHVHAPEIGRDRAACVGEAVDRGRHRAPTAQLRRDLLERSGKAGDERALATGTGEHQASPVPPPRPRAPPAERGAVPPRPRAMPPRRRRCPSTRRPPRASTPGRRRAARRPIGSAAVRGRATAIADRVIAPGPRPRRGDPRRSTTRT